MNERKSPYAKDDDDVPIIGDYSKGPNAPPRKPAPQTSAPQTSAARAPSRAPTEQWRVDPSDVRRHAAIRRQRERLGPLGRIVRYAVVACVLAAGFALYWNFDTLRGVTVDLSAVTSLFADDAGTEGGEARPFGGEPESAVVEAAGVVGANLPTSIGDPPPAAEERVAEAPRKAAPVAEQAPLARAEAPAETAPPPPAAPPEPPRGPERFAFGLDVINVSEKDASAAVIILRTGGGRGRSSVTWWTADGTATAGVDYANLGSVVVTFVPGEQNHTIHIPIVGDRNVEGPETFYVSLAVSENADVAAEPAAKIEVIIDDDDRVAN